MAIEITNIAAECGCCVAVCPVPVIDYEKKSLHVVACGWHEIDENNDYMVPPRKFSKVVRRYDVDTFEQGIVRSTAINGYRENISEYDYSANVFLGQLTCPFVSSSVGAATITRQGSSTIENKRYWQNCNDRYAWQDATIAISEGGTWSIDTLNGDAGTVVGNFSYTGPSEPVTFNCPSETVTEWDGSYSTITETRDWIPGFTTLNIHSSSTTVTTTHEDLLTWGRVQDRLDTLFVDPSNVYTSGDGYAGYDKSITSYLGVDYPEIPSGMDRQDVRFRLSVPLDHSGSYFAVRYEYECVPDDVGIAAYRFGAAEVEWTGSVDANDENSYKTAWVDVPQVVDSKVYLKKLSYRYFHSQAWLKF